MKRRILFIGIIVIVMSCLFAVPCFAGGGGLPDSTPPVTPYDIIKYKEYLAGKWTAESAAKGENGAYTTVVNSYCFCFITKLGQKKALRHITVSESFKILGY